MSASPAPLICREMSAPSSAIAATGRSPWFGLGVGVFAAFCFALSVVLARAVYTQGGAPAAIIGLRLTLVFIVVAGYALAAKKPMRLPRREARIGFALGVLLCGQTLSIYASFLYVPVSVGIMVEYVYPLLVALMMRVFAREPLAPARLVCIAAALLGLSLILRVSFGGALDPRGILLAACSAIGLSTIIVASNQLLRGVDSLRIMLHMQAGGALTALIVFTLLDAWQFPTTTAGWAALLAIPVLNGTALFCMFGAMALIGATKTALSLTTEPVFVLIIAISFLGETLAGTQALGAMLVIGALFAMQLYGARRQG